MTTKYLELLTEYQKLQQQMNSLHQAIVGVISSEESSDKSGFLNIPVTKSDSLIVDNANTFSEKELMSNFPRNESVLLQVYFLIEVAGKPLSVREMKQMLITIGYEIPHLDQRCSQFRKDGRLNFLSDYENSVRGKYSKPNRGKQSLPKLV